MKNYIIILFLMVHQVTFAHSGRTDGKGGHHDRINGRYHYHHGHGPHQHPGGKCELITNNSRNRTKKKDNTVLWIFSLLGLGTGYYLNNERKRRDANNQ